MSVSLNVYDLETDAVEVDKSGNVTITKPDQFFIDWTDAWEKGIGELYDATDEYIDLEAEGDDES